MRTHFTVVVLLDDFVIGDRVLNLFAQPLVLFILSLSDFLLLVDLPGNFIHLGLKVRGHFHFALTFILEHQLVLEVQVVVLLENSIAHNLESLPLLQVGSNVLLDLFGLVCAKLHLPFCRH